MEWKSLGLFLVVALALWGIAQAVTVTLGYGQSSGNEIFAYTTFGVAPLVAILSIYFLSQ